MVGFLYLLVISFNPRRASRRLQDTYTMGILSVLTDAML